MDEIATQLNRISRAQLPVIEYITTAAGSSMWSSGFPVICPNGEVLLVASAHALGDTSGFRIERVGSPGQHAARTEGLECEVRAIGDPSSLDVALLECSSDLFADYDVANIPRLTEDAAPTWNSVGSGQFDVSAIGFLEGAEQATIVEGTIGVGPATIDEHSEVAIQLLAPDGFSGGPALVHLGDDFILAGAVAATLEEHPSGDNWTSIVPVNRIWGLLQGHI